MTKVSLHEAPDNDNFDRLAQKIIQKLDKEETTPKENRALGEMKSLSKRWSGKISAKGILSFLANGYVDNDISEAPGGYSIFMFSPLRAIRSDNKRC
jgi:hypothetical protein